MKFGELCLIDYKASASDAAGISPQVQGRQRRAAVGLADAKSISERSFPEESLHETANFQIS